MTTLRNITLKVRAHTAAALHLGWLLIKHKGNMDCVEREVVLFRQKLMRELAERPDKDTGQAKEAEQAREAGHGG